MVIELERTFLAKYLPQNIFNLSYKDCLDLYIPETSRHFHLRIRKLEDVYEITKKNPVNGDVSRQSEHTISLTFDEYESFSKVRGRKVHKRRYYLPVGNKRAEIDMFLDDLKGLVLVDFEFESTAERDKFTPPDFCLVDITHEEFIAGGYLAGKSYSDIEHFLKKFGYKKISF